MDPLTMVSTRHTPQTEPADERQVENSAGGYVFQIDDMARLRRFLTIGTTGGTYYVGEQKLTKDTAGVVLGLAKSRGLDVVSEVVAISTAGRAPRQNPALFALAAVCGLGDDDARRAALDALPLVARTGTHLFIFAGYVEQFRGWGRGLRRAVGAWYESKSADDLAYQAVKYQQREGWSHRDLLRLSHPGGSAEHKALYEWICRETISETLPDVVLNHKAAHSVGFSVPDLVRSTRLSWEMLPSESLTDPDVWRALIDNGLPMTALIRQLPRLTNLGLLAPLSKDNRLTAVVEQLTDSERLTKARVHPMNLLVALRTYLSGESARGSSTWQAVGQIADALDKAFYAAFGAVTPANKRTMLALDVSGSMGSAIGGLPLTCREATAAIALVTAATEPNRTIVGFTGSGYMDQNTQLSQLPISPKQRLDDVIRGVSNLPFGGTDCSLPMRAATANDLEIDTFVILTDNETWAGPVMHPHQALAEYRRKSGIDARLVVVAMTPTSFTIADPSDPKMLDVSGFDTATPDLISAFSRGDV